MFRKFLNKFKDKSALAKAKQNASKIALPLTFLQKLIPIGDLPADELKMLEATLCSFKPGEIIFNRGDSTDKLVYLY
ncbi:MAG: HDOD domain-containing protein, partial [Methylosarcina sp.]